MRPVLVPILLSMTVPALAAPSRPITLARAEVKRPNAAAPSIASAWSGRVLAVRVHDERGASDPKIVGAQKEKDRLLYEWKAAQPVPEAVRKMAEETLRSWNVSVAAEAAAHLELSIRRLYVDEVPQTFGSSYRGEVEVQAEIIDAAGPSVARRVVRGTAKLSGPDRRAKLCNEALTLALEDTLAQLLTPAIEPPQAVNQLIVDPSNPRAVDAKKMLEDLVRLKDGGVGEPLLLGYVRQRRLTAPLSADDILMWKKSGLPESVIQAAQEAK